MLFRSAPWLGVAYLLTQTISTPIIGKLVDKTHPRYIAGTGFLLFAILAVFVAGLMVGRTPEYIGKKIRPVEMKYAALYFLTLPLALATAVRPASLRDAFHLPALRPGSQPGAAAAVHLNAAGAALPESVMLRLALPDGLV